MERDDTLRSIWRRFRLGGELRPLVCLAATVASGLVLAGLGLAGGWARGMLRTDPTGNRMTLGWVRDDDIGMGALIAGVAWILLLIWLWRPAVRLNRHSLSVERQRRWSTPLLATVAIAGTTTVLAFMLERKRWDDVEWAVTGLALVAGGIVVVMWLPVVFGLEHARPVFGRGGRVNVHCTRCGYSMVGLRETTCPECGKAYTLDELIAEQGYGGATPPGAGESAGEGAGADSEDDDAEVVDEPRTS